MALPIAMKDVRTGYTPGWAAVGASKHEGSPQ